RGCLSGSAEALTATFLVDCRHQTIKFVSWNQSGQLRTIVINSSANVDNTDSVMGVEHRHGITRADRKPFLEVTRGAIEERMQDQRRQRKVVDAVYLARNINLLAVM